MKSAFIRLGAAACLLGFGVAGQAQTSGVSYTYVDAQYDFASIDVPNANDVDGNGPKLFGSVAVTPWLYGVAGFERLNPDDIEMDDGSGNITVIPTDDLDTWEVGFGFNTPTLGRRDRQYRGGLIDRYSLFADARFKSQDSGGSDADGWALNAGFRSVNFTRVETIIGFGYEKFERQSGDFTLQAQLLVRIVGNLQARGGIDYSDNINRWNLGLRYNFGDFSIW